MQRWAGRVALVTGSASGIGYATVNKLVREGMKVVGCDKDEEPMKQLKAGLDQSDPPLSGKFHYIKCDLRKEEDIIKMFEKLEQDHGGIDVCVNSAGIAHKAPVLDGESWMFRDILDVNILSNILCIQSSVKLMNKKEVDDGQIIVINSMAGHHVRTKEPWHCDFTVYNATKHALVALVEGIRHELAVKKSKIRIANISPAIVQTDFTHRMYPDDKSFVDSMYSSSKKLQAEDIADEVVHILSRPPHVNIQDVWLTETPGIKQ